MKRESECYRLLKMLQRSIALVRSYEGTCPKEHQTDEQGITKEKQRATLQPLDQFRLTTHTQPQTSNLRLFSLTFAACKTNLFYGKYCRYQPRHDH